MTNINLVSNVVGWTEPGCGGDPYTRDDTQTIVLGERGAVFVADRSNSVSLNIHSESTPNGCTTVTKSYVNVYPLTRIWPGLYVEGGWSISEGTM